MPRRVYVDNGSAFVAAPLLRACAVLGIRLVHSRPGRPEGRGKIERFFRTVRDQFLVEVDAHPVTDLIEMNRLFAAWVETAYHRRVHSETKATPLERFVAGSAEARTLGLLTRHSGDMGRRSFESHSFRQHEGDRVSAKENLVRTLDLRPSCDSTEFERDLQAAFGKVPGSDAPAV